MEANDKNFQEFVEKILQIQRQKESSSEQLGEKELDDIAHSMGISLKDLQEVKQNHQTRGENHLQHQNWERAGIEFEQLVVLSPDNPKAHFGLAQTYLGLWKEQGKENDRKQAIAHAHKTLELDPHYTKAYSLLKLLEKSPQTYQTFKETNSTTPQTTISGNKVLLPIVALFCLIAGISWFISYPSTTLPAFDNANNTSTTNQSTEGLSIKESHQISGFGVATDPKGTLAWVVYYEQESNSKGIQRTHFLNIIDLKSRKVIKTLQLSDDINFMQNIWTGFDYIDGKFYWYDNDAKKLEARNPRTGEVVENATILPNIFPIIKEPIGEVKQEGNLCYLLTTQAGNEFFYKVDKRKVVSITQKNETNSDYRQKKDWVIEKLWGGVQETPNQIRFHFFQDQKSPYGDCYDKYGAGLMRGRRNQQAILAQSEETFLKGNILYGDEEYCLVRYVNEIGEEGNLCLALLDTKGKTVWKKTNMGESTFLQVMKLDWSARQLNPYRYKNTLVLSHRYTPISDKKNVPMALALDLLTGKVVWEYSPIAF